MNIVIDPMEFLHNIEHKDDFKKEIIVNNFVETSIHVYYRCYEYPKKVLNIYFFGNDFLKYKSYFKKNNQGKLIITAPNWGFSGGELKPLPGEKKFMLFKIIDTRHEFLKVVIM